MKNKFDTIDLIATFVALGFVYIASALFHHPNLWINFLGFVPAFWALFFLTPVIRWVAGLIRGK